MVCKEHKTNSKKSHTDGEITKEGLIKAFYIHKEYIEKLKYLEKEEHIKIRMSPFPEVVSENIIKFAIHKNGDTTSSWNCKNGDLFSEKDGKIECKSFTSEGPTSFSPTSEWDVIYFLDSRNWMEDSFILYKVCLKKNSHVWKNIKVSKTQTFEEQCQQGRRPRICWKTLRPQISEYLSIVSEGKLSDIIGN